MHIQENDMPCLFAEHWSNNQERRLVSSFKRIHSWLQFRAHISGWLLIIFGLTMFNQPLLPLQIVGYRHVPPLLFNFLALCRSPFLKREAVVDFRCGLPRCRRTAFAVGFRWPTQMYPNVTVTSSWVSCLVRQAKASIRTGAHRPRKDEQRWLWNSVAACLSWGLQW